jgi:ribosome-associated translation inhibitor RaiA
MSFEGSVPMKNAAVSTNAIDISGSEGGQGAEARMRTVLHKALRPVAVGPVSARVRFVDDTEPTGCPGVRCTMTVGLPHAPTVRAEETATTSRPAFDGALAHLLRQIARYRERRRAQSRRRGVKKAFAASALLGLVFVMPAYAQHGQASPDPHHSASPAATVVAPAPPAGPPDPAPMMDMCRQMMASMPDSKDKAELLRMHGEMMKAMGDMMKKHAQGMPGPGAK